MDGGAKISSQEDRVFPPQLVVLSVAATLVYLAALAVATSVLGKEFATWLGPAFLTVPFYFISRWEKIRNLKGASWREFSKVLPKLSIWKIAASFITTLATVIIAVVLFGFYLDSVRPEFGESLPEDFADSMIVLFEDPQILVMTLTLTFLSYFVGGYVAGKLSPHNYMAPYCHAVIGAFLVQALHFVMLGYNLSADERFWPLKEEDAGIIVLASLPSILIPMLGVWVAIRKHRSGGKAVRAAGGALEVGRDGAPSMPDAGRNQTLTAQTQEREMKSLTTERRSKGRKRRNRRR